MKLQEKDSKKSRNRFLIGIIFLLFFLFLASLGVFSFLSRKLNPKSALSLFSWERISPLPATDPIQTLTDLLLQEELSISFPLVASDSAILAKTTDGTQIIFSPNKDFSSQVDALQIILPRLKIEGKQTNSIDLRFDRPIVIY